MQKIQFIDKCQFCGCKECFCDSLSFHYVLCPYCGAMGPTGVDPVDAVLRWNERVE